MRLLVMLPPNPNICTITGTPVSACVSHVLHTNLSHPGIPIYRALMSHTAEPLAVRPITTSLRVLVQRRRRGRRTRPTGTSVQIKLAPPPSNPPALAARRRSYCKTLHLLLLPSAGVVVAEAVITLANNRWQMHSSSGCASWVTEVRRPVRLHRPVTVG